MIKQQFAIAGRLPGYNELHTANWRLSHRRKTDAMNAVLFYARLARLKPCAKPVAVAIRCFEPNARRDRDNVASGACKVILDALQRCGVLAGDGQRYVTAVSCAVEVDRERPRVEVELEEVEGC